MQRCLTLRQSLLRVASAQAIAASPLGAVTDLLSTGTSLAPGQIKWPDGSVPAPHTAATRSLAATAGDYRFSKRLPAAPPAEQVWDKEKQALVRTELKKRVAAWTQQQRRAQYLEHGLEAPQLSPETQQAMEGGAVDRAKRVALQAQPGGAGWREPSPAVPELAIEQERVLTVGVVGVPNSGKSTLVNHLVGQKVSAVSAKTNTTAMSVLGAFTEGEAQVALFDTPGVVASSYLHGDKHASRVRSAWATAEKCRALLIIIDAHRQISAPDRRVLRLVEEIAQGPLPGWQPVPCLLVLNKVDLLVPAEAAEQVQSLAADLLGMLPFQEAFPLSATQGWGVGELRSALLSRAQPGEWVLNAQHASEHSPTSLALEVVREKLFQRLREEVPYGVQLEPAAFNVLRDGNYHIEQNVIVSTKHVHNIVVGKNGTVIGEIGKRARTELELIFGVRVHLYLQVKHRDS